MKSNLTLLKHRYHRGTQRPSKAIQLEPTTSSPLCKEMAM